MGAGAPKEELIDDSLDIQMLPFKAIAMLTGGLGLIALLLAAFSG